MEQYQVTGMSCAACSARVEKAVSGVPGVTACSVSLLTNSMGVEGTADPGEIIRAVEAAGGEWVMLDQVLSSDLSYDENGILTFKSGRKSHALFFAVGQDDDVLQFFRKRKLIRPKKKKKK